MSEIRPKLDKLFGAWTRGEVPKKNLAQVQYPEKSGVYLLDRPGSMQSVILASQLVPPRANPDEISFEALNTVIGGAFTSRLNMNLREDKHWSYGAGSFMRSAKGQRALIFVAPVQTDKTKESMIEVNKELHDVLRARPITGDELAMARDSQVLSLPGSRETGTGVASDILELVEYGLPEDWFDTYATKIRALTTQDMATAAERLLRPDKVVWVVVGDRAKVEPGIRELGLGELHLIDADGNPVK